MPDDPAPLIAEVVVDIVVVLDALVKDQGSGWMSRGGCRDHAHLHWVPDTGESTSDARAVCARCVVQSDCLAFALRHHEVGIWGGTCDAERRRIRTARRAEQLRLVDDR